MTGTRKEALRRMVTDRRFGRWIAYALVAGDHRAEEATMKLHAPVVSVDPLRAELVRCSRIIDPAAVDEACRAAWAENRRRFLGIEKNQDRLTSDTTPRPAAAPKDE